MLVLKLIKHIDVARIGAQVVVGQGGMLSAHPLVAAFERQPPRSTPNCPGLEARNWPPAQLFPEAVKGCRMLAGARMQRLRAPDCAGDAGWQCAACLDGLLHQTDRIKPPISCMAGTLSQLHL